MAAHALPENAARQLTEWLAASHGFYTAYRLRGDQAAGHQTADNRLTEEAQQELMAMYMEPRQWLPPPTDTSRPQKTTI